MRITCPNCASEYNLPKPLAAGRIVRCAKCSQEWAPVPAVMAEPPPPPPPLPDPEPVPVPVPVPVPEKLAPMVPPQPPAVRRLPLILAWLGSGAVVAAALVAAFVFRGPIMQKWPPSERVYSALHLHSATASPDIHRNVVE